MNRLIARTGVSAVLAVLAGALAGMPATPAAAQPAGLRVTLEQDRTAVGVGDRLTVRARVVNAGAQPTDRLVAHLNVATLDSGVYVDLEDWTASPTQELDPLPPGASMSAAWEIQAVNVGSFDVYVVVLPKGGTPDVLVASPPQLVRVAGRQTLSAGGALPVAVTVPLLLGLVALGARLRLRRGR